MAQYTATTPVFAPIISEPAGAEPVYGPGVVLGKFIDSEINPSYAEGGIDGNNARAEYVKRFRELDITLNSTHLPEKAFCVMFGQTVSDDGTIIANIHDRAPYGGYGFVKGEMIDGKDVYWMIWIHKSKFSPPNEKCTTSGDNITWNTPLLEGKGIADNAGNWRTGKKFDTEQEAIAALMEKANINAEDVLGELTLTSTAGANTGETHIAVTPALGTGNSYKYKVAANPTMPAYGQVCTSGWTAWDGTADIAATAGQKIVVAEVDGDNKALKAGQAAVVVKE